MDESTRSKTSSDRLEDAISKLASHQITLGESLNAMTLKLDELIQKLLTSESPCHSPSSSSAKPPVASPSSFHRIKLEVPHFDGVDPLGWIFKFNQFFEYHSMPEHERLTISSFYTEG